MIDNLRELIDSLEIDNLNSQEIKNLLFSEMSDYIGRLDNQNVLVSANRGKKWTKVQEDKLFHNVEVGYSFEDMSHIMGRTITSLRLRFYRIMCERGINSFDNLPKEYVIDNKKDIKYLTDMFTKYGLRDAKVNVKKSEQVDLQNTTEFNDEEIFKELAKELTDSEYEDDKTIKKSPRERRIKNTKMVIRC